MSIPLSLFACWVIFHAFVKTSFFYNKLLKVGKVQANWIFFRASGINRQILANTGKMNLPPWNFNKILSQHLYG